MASAANNNSHTDPSAVIRVAVDGNDSSQEYSPEDPTYNIPISTDQGISAFLHDPPCDDESGLNARSQDTSDSFVEAEEIKVALTNDQRVDDGDHPPPHGSRRSNPHINSDIQIDPHPPHHHRPHPHSPHHHQSSDIHVDLNLDPNLDPNLSIDPAIQPLRPSSSSSSPSALVRGRQLPVATIRTGDGGQIHGPPEEIPGPGLGPEQEGSYRPHGENVSVPISHSDNQSLNVGNGEKRMTDLIQAAEFASRQGSAERSIDGSGGGDPNRDNGRNDDNNFASIPTTNNFHSMSTTTPRRGTRRRNPTTKKSQNRNNPIINFNGDISVDINMEGNGDDNDLGGGVQIGIGGSRAGQGSPSSMMMIDGTSEESSRMILPAPDLPVHHVHDEDNDSGYARLEPGPTPDSVSQGTQTLSSPRESSSSLNGVANANISGPSPAGRGWGGRKPGYPRLRGRGRPPYGYGNFGSGGVGTPSRSRARNMKFSYIPASTPASPETEGSVGDAAVRVSGGMDVDDDRGTVIEGEGGGGDGAGPSVSPSVGSSSGTGGLGRKPKHIGQHICDVVIDEVSGRICGIPHQRPFDLRRHKATVHALGPKPDFGCLDCEGKFSRRDALLRHCRLKQHRAPL